MADVAIDLHNGRNKVRLGQMLIGTSKSVFKKETTRIVTKVIQYRLSLRV